MQTVETTPKITTRIRPVPQTTVKPITEVITTDVASCPLCSRETRIGIGSTATIYHSCRHFRSVIQIGINITVSFDGAA